KCSLARYWPRQTHRRLRIAHSMPPMRLQTSACPNLRGATLGRCFSLQVRNGSSTNGLRWSAERIASGKMRASSTRRWLRFRAEKRETDTETDMMSALEEKLKEAIVGELKRQAADKPQALSVSDSP